MAAGGANGCVACFVTLVGNIVEMLGWTDSMLHGRWDVLMRKVWIESIRRVFCLDVT